MTDTPRNVFDLAARGRKVPQAYNVAIPASLKEDLTKFYWDALSHKRFVPGNTMSAEKKEKSADNFWMDLNAPCTPASLERIQKIIESVRNDYRKEYDIAAAELTSVRDNMHATNVRDLMEWQCNGQSPLATAKENFKKYEAVTNRIDRILETIKPLVPKLENPFGYAILPSSLLAGIRYLYSDLTKDENIKLDQDDMDRLRNYTLDAQAHIPLNDLKNIVATVHKQREKQYERACSNIEQFARLSNGEQFKQKTFSVKKSGILDTEISDSDLDTTRDLLNDIDALLYKQPRATVQAHPALKAGGPA